MTFVEFLLEYYVYILVVLVVLIIGVIGFLVDSKNKSDDTSGEVKKKNKRSKKEVAVEDNSTADNSVDVVDSLNNDVLVDNVSVDLENVIQNDEAQSLNDEVVLDNVENNNTSNLVDDMTVNVDKKLENVPMSQILNNMVDSNVVANSNVMPEPINVSNGVQNSVSIDNVNTGVSSLNMGQNIGMEVMQEPIYANNVNSSVNDGLVYNQGINTISSVNQPINVGVMPMGSGNVNNVSPVMNNEVNSFEVGQINYPNNVNNASFGVNSNVMNQNIGMGVMPEPVSLNNGMVQNIASMPTQVVNQSMPISAEPVNYNSNVGVVSPVMQQGVNYNGSVQQMQPVNFNVPGTQVSSGNPVNTSVGSQVVTNNAQNSGVVVTTDGAQPFDIASMFANNNQ